MFDQQTVPREGEKWHTQWEKTVQIIEDEGFVSSV